MTKGIDGKRSLTKRTFTDLEPNEKLGVIHGIASIQIGDGTIHSVHPNFHKSGSIRGMKEKYYGKDAKLIQSGDFIYNVSKLVYDKNNRLDMIALKYDEYKDEQAIKDLKDVGLLS